MNMAWKGGGGCLVRGCMCMWCDAMRVCVCIPGGGGGERYV